MAREIFEQQGYWLERGLFENAEVEKMRDHFGQMNEEGRGYLEVEVGAGDPLGVFPRIMMPHRFDELSLAFLTDARLDRIMTEILGSSPIAVQTMFYFKPPGARGQALHQDNFYLLAKPGTCVGAWLAVDDCDEENGCLQVVPGSQELPVLCTIEADTSVSFTDVTVPVPPGLVVTPVEMKAGDVLFFNGSLIHGSLPNVSSDRFRRCLIGHYVTAESTEVSKWYHPCLRMDGSEVELGSAAGGGMCGTFVEGELEMVEVAKLGEGNH
jgi:phytanoyl-CoA hydroxylase